MKRLIVVLALLMMPLALAQTQTNVMQPINPPYGAMYITQSTYDPFPASPGSYIDVWYRVENRGDETLKDVQLVLQPDGPFSLDSSESAVKSVGDLPTMQSALVKYRVRVAENALQGDYLLKLTWRAVGETDNPVFTSDISVRSATPLLVVSGVRIAPVKIAPGDKTTIEIDVANAGDGYLRYVTASLQLISMIPSATGVTVTELPFTPAGKGITESVINLAPGKTQTLSFDVVAAPDAASRQYKLPVKIDYVDNTGRNNSRTEIVGISVTAEPDLLVYVDKSDLTGTTAPADVVLRFVNRGRADIKFLTVTLQDQDGYTVINAPTQYVGGVASDDYETTSWTLKLDKTASELDLPLVVSYEDVNGMKYSTGLSVHLPIRSAAATGQQGTSYILVVVIAIVVVVIAVIIWRRRRVKHKRV
jgi:hypothetical protein